MYEAYSTAVTTYNQNNPIEFPNVRIADCRVDSQNGTTFILKRAGYYYITFTGTGSSGTAQAPFTLQFYVNGNPIPGTETTVTPTVANEYQTLATSTIVKINPSCCAVDNTASIQLVATSSAAGSLSNGNIIIMKMK